ncbi:hypothetical protein EV368DRAFT_66312 [Lentinula lateritia]|uniref:Uncharacterized protein n=1 Tax=Lentinula aff. lateritia TaxID=2804960 RepID=A0ACC1UCL0_9AGAR|nr:hypothetical protein F5876DRAFT_62097 [Lentinula aff. lateritia]KAJ3850763.1 hypothetical protein EV368DRAFT_66312 [Lentinula lateritia]
MSSSTHQSTRFSSDTLEGMFDEDPDSEWSLKICKELFGKDEGSQDSEFNKHTRRIYKIWPRDPKGGGKPCIMSDLRELSAGYRTNNSHHLWGATTLDFYMFRSFNDECADAMLGFSSGSKLYAWMKAHGELYAKDELEWAEMEQKPRLRPAADILEIIGVKNLAILMGSCGISMRDDDNDDDGEATATEEESVENETISAIPRPFDYENYPDPWPLVPFSSDAPTLQSPIPFHLLPETLIVHDPFRLLNGDDPPDESDVDWTSVDDITHRYSLNLTVPSIKDSIAAERAKITEAASKDGPVLIGIVLDCPNSTESGIGSSSTAQSGTAFKMTVPSPPASPSSIAEAHLFISPAEFVGKGHHSVVYRAEWDLPRSVFSKYVICHKCVEEAAKKIFSEDSVSNAAGDTSSASDRAGRADEIVGRNFILRKQHLPVIDMTIVREGQPEDENTPCYSVGGETVDYLEYTGESMPTVHVDTVPWYDSSSTDPAPCSHLAVTSSISGPLPGPVPPTASVSVIAKLSVYDDNHLEKEAKCYQSFGEDFSQHWSGYTVALPIRDPTPTGAITPNFYGFYSKEEDKTNDNEEKVIDRHSFLSPILLIEDCGQPIEVEKLSLDDRQECAALLFRLHHHGWTHGSFAHRNIVMQIGDHGDFPLMKSRNARRFRLIDFGRAWSLKDAIETDQSSSRNGDNSNGYVGRTEKEWRRAQFQEKNEVWRTLMFRYPI